MTNAHNVLTRVLVLAAVAGLIMPIATGAQPPTPDLLSVYVGMPQNAARATLQKRMPGSILINGADGGFTLAVNDPNNRARRIIPVLDLRSERPPALDG